MACRRSAGRRLDPVRHGGQRDFQYRSSRISHVRQQKRQLLSQREQTHVPQCTIGIGSPQYRCREKTFAQLVVEFLLAEPALCKPFVMVSMSFSTDRPFKIPS
jgi:hypothetical protein